MSIWERVLLYSVAAGLAAVLLIGGDGERKATTLHVEDIRNVRSVPTALAPAVSVGTAPERIAPSVVGATESYRESLIIADRQGRPRIEMRVDDRGQPEIVMRSETGDSVLALRTDSAEEAEIVLKTRAGQATLRNERSGLLMFELRGKHKAHTRMTVLETGETELSTGRPDGGLALLRSDVDGVVEMGIRGPDGKSGPSMSWEPSGEAFMRVVGKDGTSGPLMQLFPDGLGQIAINGGGSESGPSMMRLPDGVAVVSVRLSNGEPGAAMVASPDGTSVVAATSPDGKQRAELRIDAEGNARSTVTPQAGTPRRSGNSDPSSTEKKSLLPPPEKK